MPRRKRKTPAEARDDLARDLVLEIDQLVADLKLNQEFLRHVWSLHRDRGGFVDSLRTGWSRLGLKDLALLDPGTVALLDAFYRGVSDLELYLAHTEDMPASVEDRYERSLERLRRFGAAAVARLGGVPPVRTRSGARSYWTPPADAPPPAPARLRAVLADEIGRILEDCRSRRELLLGQWGFWRDRGVFQHTLFTRWTTMRPAELVGIDAATVMTADRFYAHLEAVRAYLATTEDMPETLTVRYDELVAELVEKGEAARALLGNSGAHG